MIQPETQTPPRICVLGGGFGGLYTALNLTQFPWETTPKPEIVLVDQRDRFVFLPLLYELLTGELETWEIAPPFTELLADTGIQFHQQAVSRIDLEAKTVYFSQTDSLVSSLASDALTYDYLVLALGGETPMDIVPGAADHAIPFRTIADAYQVEERLRSLEQSDQEKIRVAVVGGGYSGVELACKLAERLGDRGRLRIIEMGDQILRTSTDFNRGAARKALSDRQVWLDLETRVAKIEADAITLVYRDQDDVLPVDLVLWTVGTKVADVITQLPLAKSDRGQLKVNTKLQVLEYPHIFALGDLAESFDATGQRVPTTAQSTFQQAQFAAWNIWATAGNEQGHGGTERPLLPFRYQHLGEMMALGLDNATLTGLGITLDGPLAHVARRLAYLYRMPTLDHQIKVGLNWIAKPVRDLLSVG
ncbi:MAG: NAD(P)/FAD-dependent oxidoreductase [Cyanothece sp. SIO2G6]|nr:NAD(P)/FAD-dependent oxidoreductase [Cyanothece sp. SIO2G6]